MKIRKKSSDLHRPAATEAPGRTGLATAGSGAAPFRVSSVGHGLQTKAAAKAAPKKKEVTVTQTGSVLQDTATHQTVGFTRGADCYVYVSAKDTPVEASQAGLGKLSKNGGLNLDITRVRKLAGQAPTPPPASSAPASAAPSTVLGGAIAGSLAGAAAATPSAPVTLDISANQGELLGIVFDGLIPVPVVQYAKSWDTLPYEKLPTGFQAQLPPLSKIQFAEGTIWVVQDHRINKDNTLLASAKRQWVKANHTTTEFTKNKGSLEKVLTDSGLGTGAVDAQTLKAIAAIMTVEGSFGAVSPTNDKAASLGIFQWATTKKTAVEKGSSLNKFLVDLYTRSTAAKTNTGLDKVYKDAWKALSDKGLTISNGLVQLNGKTPTGQELEDSLHGTMGSNTSLKAYQILRSGEQIDHLLDITVAPGPLGSVFSDKLGATLDTGSGGSFTLKSSKTKTHKITFKKPSTAAAIRDTISSMRAKTYIYNLYTNRPAYAGLAVWRAFRGTDYSSTIQTAMDALIASWTLHETTTKVKKKATQFSEEQVRALNDPTANAALDQIKAILWVNKDTESLAEETLLENFVKEGLEIYGRRETQKDSYLKDRPARLASSETGDW